MSKRRSKRRAPVTTDLPSAALHFVVTGEVLLQVDGERRYGAAFNWLDAYDPELHPTPERMRAVWARHQAAIEAHARMLGRDRPWIADQLGPDIAC